MWTLDLIVIVLVPVVIVCCLQFNRERLD
jgi:hypothetical protein